MGNTFTDLSQLKKFRPAEPEPPPPEPEKAPEDRQLAGATSSTDYFSSLLGTPSAQRQKAPPRRATVVTPGTVARVRAEQAEDAFAAERDALNAKLEERQAVIDALALDAAEAKESLARAQEELKQAQDELAQARARADGELRRRNSSRRRRNSCRQGRGRTKNWRSCRRNLFRRSPHLKPSGPRRKWMTR